MLLTIIVVLVLALGTRYFLARLTTTSLSNAVAGIVALSFVLGLISSRLFFGAASGAAASSTAAAPAVAPPPSTLGPHVIAGQNVSEKCRTAKLPVSAQAAGWFDSIVRDSGGARIGEGANIERGRVYWLNGWAGTPSMQHNADGVCLLVDGRIEPRAVAYYGIPRPDVAAQFSALDRSGFDVEVTPGMLSPGQHRLQVIAGADGSYYLLHGERTITVR